ncbi:acyl-CoA:lysophosphatidylglycerol acyltransferase 1 [Trichonephila clavata]|uniref:Acyl-CoA:lysophosphatidylglycerol acyltransferase 1 n=1 Tax=Trichonephila clavata TaxID=2740835 RepID=A0A8X6I6X5_TRICU|nr:acyl-CoA:lysophosphatidylglycerol acyltransferase 1 [Trichonephila clavata]
MNDEKRGIPDKDIIGMDLRQFLHLTKSVLNVSAVVITNLYCIPTYLLWMWVILLPFRILNHPGYWYLESIMYKWLLNIVATWSWRSKIRLVEMGDDINTCIQDRCLFLVNHQSTGDVPLLMQAFQEKDTVLESVMWIMDRMFRYTNFGAVSVTHGDYFITQGKHVRDYQMKRLRDHLLKVFIGRNRKWIILFPEGGFLSKRLETSVKYATKNNFPVLEHVTLPRIGAMEVILNTLRPDGNLKDIIDNEVALLNGTAEECEPLKWVVDLTVAYPDPQKPVDLLAICASNRPPCSVYLHYRCYPINEVPMDDTESLRNWTYDRWCEKEEMLKEYYMTGTFPHLPVSQRKNGTFDDHIQRSHNVTMEFRQIVFFHTVFISSTLFHCYLLYKVWNYCQY